MIGKIVDKGTIKSLNNALHLKKYNHLLIFRQKMFQSRFLTGMMGEISQAVLFIRTDS